VSIRIKAFVAPAVLLACLAWICAQSLMALARDLVRASRERVRLLMATATGARDQAAGLDHVNAAIGQMDQKTQRDAAMAEESNAASQTLAEETRLLYAMIGRFQIGDQERRVPPPERALRRA
jgi:methyl-accepting chemotaxis protein